VYESSTGFALVIQHKWLIEPETVAESNSNDIQRSEGVLQAEKANQYQTGPSRSEFEIPGHDCFNSHRAIRVCPSGPRELNRNPCQLETLDGKLRCDRRGLLDGDLPGAVSAEADAGAVVVKMGSRQAIKIVMAVPRVRCRVACIRQRHSCRCFAEGRSALRLARLSPMVPVDDSCR
jgi:hypothetical protein